MKYEETEPKEVVVRVYVSAETDDEAVDKIDEELNWLCGLDNSLLAFTLENEK